MNIVKQLKCFGELFDDRWKEQEHHPIRPSKHLAVDEGDAVSVAGQLSDGLRPVLSQRPSVPHLAQSVVAARKEQLRRAVGKRHRVHVVLVGIDLRREGHAKKNGRKESMFPDGAWADTKRRYAESEES